MSKFTKSSISRLSKRAGATSITPEACVFIEKLLIKQTNDILKNSLYITRQKKSKTLLKQHVLQGMKIMNIHITK